jgi:methyl-accepting chemotaxis protein
MNTLTIPRRIALGLAALVLVGVLLGVVSLWRIDGINRHVRTISGNSLPSVVTLSRIIENNSAAMTAARSALLAAAAADNSGATAARATFDRAAADGAALCDEYLNLISDEEDGRIFAAARVARDTFLGAARQALDLVAAGDDGAALAKMRGDVENAARACVDLFKADIDHNVRLADRAVAAAGNAVRTSGLVIGAMIGAASLLGLLLGTVVIRSTTRVLRTISATLEENAAQAATASGQLATISQTVAAGCGAQGSSVAETSTALEQMSAMIRSTAGNAAQAKDLAVQARSAAETGARTMVDMNAAMRAIEDSSAEVAKIVKDIDEIAFQTNILALNAAVEAARAGAAGAGFAVVADEVRSLAQRSAAAARETAAKIEAAIASSRLGGERCARVGASLDEIATTITAADTLVAEIATAAREQAQGIGQIGSAMADLDKVTQDNAARAAEGASAAAELTSQAQSMREHVEWLRSLVSAAAQKQPGAARARPPAAAQRPGVGPRPAPRRRPAVAARPVHHTAPPRIPMPGDSAADAEERNFKDF